MVIANNDPVAQEKIIKYNDLVANAVIFQNVVDLTDILRDLLKAGHFINREDVAGLSPYMTSHIKRFGDYLIDMEAVPNLLDDEVKVVLVMVVGFLFTKLYNVSHFTGIPAVPQLSKFISSKLFGLFYPSNSRYFNKRQATRQHFIDIIYNSSTFKY